MEIYFLVHKHPPTLNAYTSVPSWVKIKQTFTDNSLVSSLQRRHRAQLEPVATAAALGLVHVQKHVLEVVVCGVAVAAHDAR